MLQEVFEKYDTAFVTYEPPKTIYEVLVQEKALSRKKLDEVGFLVVCRLSRLTWHHCCHAARP